MSPQQNKAFEVVRALNYCSMSQLVFITFLTIQDGQFVFKGYTLFFGHIHIFSFNHYQLQKQGRLVYKAVEIAGYHQPVFQEDEPHFSFYQGLPLSGSCELVWSLHCTRLHCSKTTCCSLFYTIHLYFLFYIKQKTFLGVNERQSLKSNILS